MDEQDLPQSLPSSTMDFVRSAAAPAAPVRIIASFVRAKAAHYTDVTAAFYAEQLAKQITGYIKQKLNKLREDFNKCNKIR